MERRDFLLGSLVGVGVGVAAEEVLQRVSAGEAADGEAPVPAQQPRRQLDPGATQPSCRPESWTPDNVVRDPAGRSVDLGPLGPDGRKLSYAQQGEDLVLHTVFHELGIKTPSYVDIGAFHPSISNNTYLAYLRGSRGLLVEPNPHMVELLKKHRPGDRVLGVGVGVDDRTEAEYYLIRDRPQLNTFSREQAKGYEARFGANVIEKVINVALLDINAVIDENLTRTPDLISIDTEGLDLAILSRLDFSKHRPAAFCVETVQFGTTGEVGGITKLMAQREYVARAGTFMNTIYVAKERLAPA